MDYAVRIGLGLQIKGLMNVQCIIMREATQSAVYVLEVNPRASRTVPFISKVTGVPAVKIATKVMAGISLREQGYETGLWKKRGLVGIKAPVFSMSKLIGVEHLSRPGDEVHRRSHGRRFHLRSGSDEGGDGGRTGCCLPVARCC